MQSLRGPSTGFLPGLQGLPLVLTGSKQTQVNLSFLSDRLPSCRFSRLQGLAIKGESVAKCRHWPVPTPVLGPFRVLHGMPCRPPLPAPAARVLLPLREKGLDFSGLFHDPRVSVRSCDRLNLYPPGCSTLQGFPPVCRFLPFPTASLFTVHRPSGFTRHPGRPLHNPVCTGPDCQRVSVWNQIRRPDSVAAPPGLLCRDSHPAGYASSLHSEVRINHIIRNG